MLSNLSMNMKILIGISSITLLGIIYGVIKKYLGSPKKIMEGQNNNNNNNNNNTKQNTVLSNEITSEIKALSKNMKTMLKLYRDHIDISKDHINNVNKHQKFIIDNHHNVYRRQITIVLDNNNTEYNNSTNELTINKDKLKSELGFPYSIYSMVFVNAVIPKTASYTPFIKLIVSEPIDLQQLLANYNILSVIPLKNTPGTSNNEEISNYTVANINHNIVKRPITIQSLTLKLLQADGSTHHDLTNLKYSITIEIVVEQGSQVPENNENNQLT